MLSLEPFESKNSKKTLKSHLFYLNSSQGVRKIVPPIRMDSVNGSKLEFSENSTHPGVFLKPKKALKVQRKIFMSIIQLIRVI